VNLNETDEAEIGRIRISDRSFMGLIYTVQAIWIATLVCGGAYLASGALGVN